MSRRVLGDEIDSNYRPEVILNTLCEHLCQWDAAKAVYDSGGKF